MVRDETDIARQRLRWFIAIRTRIAEDALAAVQNGVRQLVVLGAGLDTYAYRAPPSDDLRIFEVDHPLTQAWKRERLADAAIATPATLRFVPVDFEHEALADGLAAAGFDPAQQTFFSWLGVVPYLTEQAVFATLGFIAGLPGGAHVVFDHIIRPLRSLRKAGARRMKRSPRGWPHSEKPSSVTSIAKHFARGWRNSASATSKISALVRLRSASFQAASRCPAAALMCCAQPRSDRIASSARSG